MQCGIGYHNRAVTHMVTAMHDVQVLYALSYFGTNLSTLLLHVLMFTHTLSLTGGASGAPVNPSQPLIFGPPTIIPGPVSGELLRCAHENAA